VVAAICRRLDGIPLALELAAARVRALTLEHIAARLDDAVHLLTGGSRTALPRQQTLRAAIDWSHDLLEPTERVVFRRLAVFVGGWTLEAAEAVCAGEGIAVGEVLDRLAALVDKSLVQVEDQGGTARYRLLETVRQYGLERLREAGEEAATRRRHLDWCLTLGETAAPHLEGEGALRWLARLDAEHDNLRAALAWGLDHDAGASLGLAGNLRHYWRTRSSYAEAHHWYDQLLSRAPTPTVARIRALLGAAWINRQLPRFAVALACGEEALALSRARGETRLTAEALYMVARVHTLQGDLGLARQQLEEGVAISRAGEDWSNLGQNLYWLGRLALAQGEFAEARACLEETLALGPARGALSHGGGIMMELAEVALCQGDAERATALLDEALARGRRTNSRTATASALARLTRVATWRGDLERAVRLAEESLALARSMAGNQRGTGDRLVDLGRALYYQGDLASARARLEEALVMQRASGQRPGTSAALHGLGLVAWQEGGTARATAYLRESLALRHELGERLGLAECLEGLAQVAAGSGRPDGAARWLGAAEALRTAIGAPLPPVSRPDHAATVAAARPALGEAAFAAAWADGQTVTLEEVIAEALAGEEAAPT
jgi:tetratricopeptide (TPR) repeat protein